MTPPRIHPSSDVSPSAVIGDGTIIWQDCQVRENAHLGQDCILGKGVYVDAGVVIGNKVKIQNYVSIYHGVTIEDGVFIGPHVCFTNDLNPRAINPDGALKSAQNWVLTETSIAYGASIGANATIRCGVSIGKWAMVGAGSVVTHDVPDFGLAYSNPARLQGYVCVCGERLVLQQQTEDTAIAVCPQCGRALEMPLSAWEKAL